MKKRISQRSFGLAIAIGLLAGCGSSNTGPQGPVGPAGPPADRSKLYCKSSGAILNASNLETTVACDSKTDIPWQGACEAPNLPSGLYLSRDEPIGWNDVTQVPGWRCTWAAFDVVPDQNFGANAEICCFAVGQGT